MLKQDFTLITDSWVTNAVVTRRCVKSVSYHQIAVLFGETLIIISQKLSRLHLILTTYHIIFKNLVISKMLTVGIGGAPERFSISLPRSARNNR